MLTQGEDLEVHALKDGGELPPLISEEPPN